MQKMTSETQQAISKCVIQSAFGLVGYGFILFLASGNLAWIWGWVLMATLTAFSAAHPLILIPINPELFVEQKKGIGDNGVKSWDKWIAALAGGVMPIISWILAGLDVRFR